MKRKSIIIHILAVTLCIFTLLSLGSCTADMEIGNNSELGKEFMDHVILGEKDAAFAMTGDTVGASDFDVFWTNVRSVTNGASSYEMKQIGWNVNVSGGVTTNTTAYQIKFDNGSSILFRVMTQDGTDGIAGIYFHDATDFLADSEKTLPVAKLITTAISILSWAFIVWMIVDCSRRKMKNKVIWIIITLLGFCVTLTLGQKFGFDFMFTLMLRMNSVVADPGVLAMKYTVCIPLGAIIYFFMRKNLTVTPAPAPEFSEPPVTEGATDGEQNKTENQN